VKREPVESSVIGFSGMSQSAGIGKPDPELGFPVDDHWIATYYALIRKYGESFVPPLKIGEGVKTVDGVNYVDAEHMTDYLDMCGWLREEGRKRGKSAESLLDKFKGAVGL
jgi:hypothetical protein